MRLKPKQAQEVARLIQKAESAVTLTAITLTAGPESGRARDAVGVTSYKPAFRVVVGPRGKVLS